VGRNLSNDVLHRDLTETKDPSLDGAAKAAENFRAAQEQAAADKAAADAAAAKDFEKTMRDSKEWPKQ
jgi:hypothetical protein